MGDKDKLLAVIFCFIGALGWLIAFGFGWLIADWLRSQGVG